MAAQNNNIVDICRYYLDMHRFIRSTLIVLLTIRGARVETRTRTVKVDFVLNFTFTADVIAIVVLIVLGGIFLPGFILIFYQYGSDLDYLVVNLNAELRPEC